jgi:hypothetical protein
MILLSVVYASFAATTTAHHVFGLICSIGCARHEPNAQILLAFRSSYSFPSLSGVSATWSSAYLDNYLPKKSVCHLRRMGKATQTSETQL